MEGSAAAKQFELNRVLRSTSSSGIPNGPYSGPVYSRVCQPGRIELNGSNTFEGVYFVKLKVGKPGALDDPMAVDLDDVRDFMIDNGDSPMQVDESSPFHRPE